MILSRRSLLVGLIAAPAIVKASSLMPMRAFFRHGLAFEIGEWRGVRFISDIEEYIRDKTLPLARRHLVAYQFGDPLILPKGTTYAATRYTLLPPPMVEAA